MRLAFCFAAISFPAYAGTLTGLVVGVVDGDTVKVLTDEMIEERVRLSGIDSPERGQPFGQVSKKHLSDQVYNQYVTVEWHKRDRYQRIVGRVMVNGVDANLEQLRAGWAWHYKRYEGEQSADERQLYATAEAEARKALRGLWQDPEPVAPWDWRKSR